MPGAQTSDRLKVLLGAACIVFLANLAHPASAIAATLRVSWASGTEADLAGYRLKYGTSPGQYDTIIDVGDVTTCEVPGLEVDLRYYIAIIAYDMAGLESAPSAEVSARLPGSLAPIPSIEAALEQTTRSIYALRGRTTPFILYGRNFAPGVAVDLGEGISHGQMVLSSLGNLQFYATVDAQAATGPRTVTVWNPDGGLGGRTESMTVVKSPDINDDCHVDVIDLNALARAWNEVGGESGYTPDADFDGDGYIGPDDLAIFVQYYLRVFPGCP